MNKFPQGFFWGAATSAYQVEGENVHSDWWYWEKEARLKDLSGEACRHYELYPADFNLAKSLNHNAHRLSIEWARVEPEEGKFNQEAIVHYRQVLKYLKGLGIEPFVTLHHFTNPLWFAKNIGWESKKSVIYFNRYVEKIAFELGKEVKFWLTINEPMVYVYQSYLLGLWPPQKKSFSVTKRVISNLIKAHCSSYQTIHKIYNTNNFIKPSVGIAANLQFFLPCTNRPQDKFAAYLRDKLFNRYFIDKITARRNLDFIGINYYTRSIVELRGLGLKNLFLDTCQANHHPAAKNSLGWDICPSGLYQLLLAFKKYHLPIAITENGICIDDDSVRWDFIREHLQQVSLAIEKGVDIFAYLYWSLLDNFEWDKGFNPRFGLIDVDYSSYERRVRESAKKLAVVCRNNQLD